jgi:hypothetical protein
MMEEQVELHVEGQNYIDIWSKAGKLIDGYYTHGKWKCVSMQSFPKVQTTEGEVLLWQADIVVMSTLREGDFTREEYE